MKNTLFDKPLFAKRHRYIQELCSFEDVCDFLDEWPDEKRDTTYEVLAKASRMAAQGIFPLPAFRENVRRFLIRQGALANIDKVPLFAKRMTDCNIGS